MAAKKAAPKVEDQHDEQPVAVSDTGRAPEPPDEDGAPMSYDARGDAHVITTDAPKTGPYAERDAHALPVDPETGYGIDPLLAPESQHPGESAEHFAERSGKPQG